MEKDTAENRQRLRTPWGAGAIRGSYSLLPAPAFAFSSLPLSLPSSQRPLSSPFLTGSGALLLTYKMWCLSTSVERQGARDGDDGIYTLINDLERGRLCLEGGGGRERVNWWCVDVFQMLMCHFRTKENVSERKVRKKFRTIKQITSANSFCGVGYQKMPTSSTFSEPMINHCNLQ